ncbi:MAG: hypothetical protein KDC79_02380 [Cyclobacteriaceae bacterium]|nr:hypothetical protein [Cyclobacteriaceae bacterium]
MIQFRIRKAKYRSLLKIILLFVLAVSFLDEYVTQKEIFIHAFHFIDSLSSLKDESTILTQLGLFRSNFITLSGHMYASFIFQVSVFTFYLLVLFYEFFLKRRQSGV